MKELLDLYIPERHSLNNYKPSWLAGLEMDRYYPSLRVAFEFQGDQHFGFSFSLHDSHGSFFRQVFNDKKKKQILVSKKIMLIEVSIPQLAPSVFKELLFPVFLEDLPNLADQDLESRIDRYQKGVFIHYKKELKSYVEDTPFRSFLDARSPFSMSGDLLFLDAYGLDSSDKYAYCVLASFAKEGEVLLDLLQISRLLPSFDMREACLSLERKKAILIQPDFQLVRLRKPEWAAASSFLSGLPLKGGEKRRFGGEWANNV